jgi:uncharacterized membrane protein YcaP (DUF421 family)
MEFVKELYILLGRIVTILPLMLAMTLYMGKRSIAELPVFDFLVIVILGAVVGADIADPEIAHVHTAAAIVLIGIFHRIISKLKIRYRKFGHVITFEPTIVIQDGKFILTNMRRIRYSIDNLLQMLREKDVFDVNEVHLGIIEANGNISVLKKGSKSEVTVEDLKLTNKEPSIAYAVIIDGKINNDVLAKLSLTDIWLKQQLLNLQIKDVSEVFFGSVNNKKELQVSLKSYMENKDQILPIYN